MKTNKTFIPLAILLVTFMVAGEANNFVYASSDYDRALEEIYAEQSESSQVTKTHSVKKGETLLGIAAKKGTRVSAFTALNNIQDPNHIWVGQELRYIDYSGDSVKMGPVVSTPKIFPQGRKIISHVILPDKDDVFAPAQPQFVYEVVEMITAPKEPMGQIKVFQSLMAFFKWLDGSDYSKQTKGSGTQQRVDPSSSSPYMVSSKFNFDTVFNDSLSINSDHTFFDSYHPDTLTPPPKQA
jgi:LysM repeat protein